MSQAFSELKLHNTFTWPTQKCCAPQTLWICFQARPASCTKAPSSLRPWNTVLPECSYQLSQPQFYYVFFKAIDVVRRAVTSTCQALRSQQGTQALGQRGEEAQLCGGLCSAELARPEFSRGIPEATAPSPERPPSLTCPPQRTPRPAPTRRLPLLARLRS